MATQSNNMDDLGDRSLRGALRENLLEIDTANCLELDEALRIAHQAAPPEQRGRYSEHMEGCPLCASTVADLRSAIRPVLRLHHGLAGWLGPVLAYLGVLLPGARRQWAGHAALCARCTDRAERLRSLFAPPVVAALGAACAALVIFTAGGHAPLPAAGGTDGGSGLGQRTSKGGLPTGGAAPIAWPTSVTVLENYLYPTRHPDEVEKYWKQILEAHPESLAAHEALAGIYTRRAGEPARRAEAGSWRAKAAAERQELKRLVNASAAPGKEGSKQ